jgi:hypothetical protein
LLSRAGGRCGEMCIRCGPVLDFKFQSAEGLIV